MIFTMYSIFETCSEFDGENFCKYKFLKTKMKLEIMKFGFIKTFKNDFFKNLFLQKFFPSNSEQVSKILYMVKIISLASRNDFPYFLLLFADFHF